MTPKPSLAQTALSYEQQGFRVIVRPTDSQLPPFAAGFAVDLMALKDGENVIVQLKESRQDLEEDTSLVDLVQGADQAGWRLDLVVLGPDDPFARIEAATEFHREQIEDKLNEAERLTSAGELTLACVMAWSALEAAMRQSARFAGLKLRATSPTFLIRSLYSQGLLNRDELDRLDDTIKYRNGAVHAMSVPGLTAAVPMYVVGVARRLLGKELQARGA